MYEELIKRLKNCATQAAPCETCGLIEDGSCSDTLMKQAADAIEELMDADRKHGCCPLVEVETHGDLIDRDKLEKDIDKYIGGEESRSRFHHWVQVQSVVIPGNKGEQT